MTSPREGDLWCAVDVVKERRKREVEDETGLGWRRRRVSMLGRTREGD